MPPVALHRFPSYAVPLRGVRAFTLPSLHLYDKPSKRALYTSIFPLLGDYCKLSMGLKR